MKILVTGAQGFIGRNLCVRLEENGFSDLIRIDHQSPESDLLAGLHQAEFVFHLAGVNRPQHEDEFSQSNIELTQKIVEVLKSKKNQTPIMFSSSTQAINDNAYGISKAAAEKQIRTYGEQTGSDYFIYRLPNVFGKWCKPNYNSFIATFCHNISRGIDITIHDPLTSVSLIYIDDLCHALLNLLSDKQPSGYKQVLPEYSTTVGAVADLLHTFKQSRQALMTEEVGTGFIRALYSTWLSYLSPEQFSYSVPFYGDERGVFCEMLKTKSSGQFSFFTAHPGITRGGHYHHSKNEKFLVIKGHACFRFEHIITHEKYELTVSSDAYQIVETIPGWSHDITNIGDDELIVMLWANEIFDRNNPDTIARPL